MFRSLQARRRFFRFWSTQTPTKRGYILRLLSDWTNNPSKGFGFVRRGSPGASSARWFEFALKPVKMGPFSTKARGRWAS
jgi:uncharacterized RDD family membrane protein YckC